MVAAVSHCYDHLVERLIIIDCRYPYEFEGGHIKVSGSMLSYPDLFARHCTLFPVLHELNGRVSGSSEPPPRGPGGGFPPQNAHHPVLPGQTHRHHLPLRVFVRARPSDVPLRQGAWPRHERVSRTLLPRALHPQRRVQGVLPPIQGWFIQSHHQVHTETLWLFSADVAESDVIKWSFYHHIIINAIINQLLNQ